MSLAEFAMGGGGIDIPGSSPAWSTRARRRPAPHRPATSTDCFPCQERRHVYGATTALSTGSFVLGERKHCPLSNLRGPDDTSGLQPFLKQCGGMTVAASIDAKKKYPNHERLMSLTPQPPAGKRTIAGGTSPVCMNPLGPVGSVKVVIDPLTNAPRANFKSDEYCMKMLTGSVRKFPNDAPYHASNETPVSFPGYTNYPPNCSPTGQPIDYMLHKKHLSVLSEPKLTESWHRSRKPPGFSGDSTQFTRSVNPIYQNDIVHSALVLGKSPTGLRVYDPAAMAKMVKYPKLGSQTIKYGFRNT